MEDDDEDHSRLMDQSLEEDDIEFDHDGDDEDEELLMQKLEEIGDSGRNKHKTFDGIPK